MVAAPVYTGRGRRGVVGVMGSGTDEHAGLAEPLGRWLAAEGFDLLTGGGQGVMAAACRGFQAVAGRRGVAVGVLPAGPPPGYPNPWVDLAIYTHLPQRGAEGAGERSRNHLNVLSSHALAFLPGGAGTRTELELARRYGRPFVAFLGLGGSIEGVPRDQLPEVAVTLEEAAAFVRRHLPAAAGPPGGR
jgi:uncharacterized protein (TIGR00725 family)